MSTTADVEHAGIAAKDIPEGYGSIDKKVPDEAELPLLLGYWKVSPDQIFNIGMIGYVVWFMVHRIADIAYIALVDCRFAAGLGHYYPSEAQRLDSVRYTQQMILVMMLQQTAIFCVVIALFYFKSFVRLDKALREVPAWLEQSTMFGRPYNWCGNFKDHVWNGRLATEFSNNTYQSYLGRLAGRAYNGRLVVAGVTLVPIAAVVTAIVDRLGSPKSFRELFLGSVYLTVFACLFYAIGGPFQYWSQYIDLHWGFANSLSVSLANFRGNFVASIIVLLFSWPQKFLLLAVLQYRLGWLFMWLSIVAVTLFANNHVTTPVEVGGMEARVFPTGTFAVGRGFPMVETSNPYTPWISLNRIFWPQVLNPYANASSQETETPEKFYTKDKSKGKLFLTHEKSGQWAIKASPWFDSRSGSYAQTKDSATNFVSSPTNKTHGAATALLSTPELLKNLADQSWTLGGAETHMGIRSGKVLRDKLFGFARARHLGIKDIYMIDGSYQDARANAFVTGANNKSEIGLYDTLFLGQRGKEASEYAQDEEADDQTLIEHVSELVQGVDLDEQKKKAPRNSAPTQAMNDDEIVAILAHELGHSDLGHMQSNIAAAIFMSGVSFATMGWMAHSPLAAAALSMGAPLIHVGLCAYEHVVGPPIDGFMKLFTDAQTRKHEYEADAYAALIAEKYGTGLQSALAKLSVNSNQDPGPPLFYEALHSDHPSFAQRWENIEKVKKKAYGL